MKGKQNCGTTFSILTSPRALQRTVQWKDGQALTMLRPPIVLGKGKYGLVGAAAVGICYFAQTTITSQCVISLKQQGVQGIDSPAHCSDCDKHFTFSHLFATLSRCVFSNSCQFIAFARKYTGRFIYLTGRFGHIDVKM